eukprot:CFRG1125T1
MVRLQNDEFLTTLVLLFEKTRKSGSIMLTVKKNTSENAEYAVLVRATFKKNKFSTEVSNNDISSFNERLFVAYRGQCSALKKKEKRRPKKSQNPSNHAKHTN